MGLNPCSNGRYSQSGGSLDLSGTGITVLILVLMEDTLRESMNAMNNFTVSLNPCSNGRYSQRVEIFADCTDKES